MPTVRLSYKWVDDEGVNITTGVYQDISDFAEVADYQAQWGDTRTVLEAVSGAKVVEGWVEIPMVVGAPGTPVSFSRVNSGATLSFRNSDGVADDVYIPAMLPSQLVGKVVNSETTEMVALRAKAIGAGEAEPWSTRGSASQFVSYIKGFMSTRKVKR